MEFKFNTFLNVLLHIHIITMVICCCVSSTEMHKKQKKKSSVFVFSYLLVMQKIN